MTDTSTSLLWRRSLGMVTFCLLMFATAVNADVYVNVLIEGRAQPYITSTGGAIGVNPTTGQVEETVAGASIGLEPGVSNILFINPPSDTYTFTLHGSYDDRSAISITYFDDITGKREEHDAAFWFHGAQITSSFTVDTSLDPAIQLSSPVEGPSDLQVLNVGGNVRLNWSAVTDPTVTAYRVYGRLEAYPRFQILGETPALTFDAGHPVRQDDTGEHWQYIVLSVNAVGEESFYADPVTNLLTLTALFIANETVGVAPLTVDFSDYSLGTVSTWAWDFDGDSIIDSALQNPSHTYTQTGVYDVTLTVTGPLGSSIQSRSGYIAVIVDTDGDGLSDTYELALGLNPNTVDTDGDGLVDGQGGIVPISNYPSGIDLDMDGLIDGEQDLGTSSDVADTDGDGVNDGQETMDGTDPFDRASFFALATGDVNDDGQVDVGDLFLAIRIMTNLYTPSPAEQARWDVAPLVGGLPQPDGQNNLGDYVVLQRKVIGSINF